MAEDPSPWAQIVAPGGVLASILAAAWGLREAPKFFRSFRRDIRGEEDKRNERMETERERFLNTLIAERDRLARLNLEAEARNDAIIAELKRDRDRGWDLARAWFDLCHKERHFWNGKAFANGQRGPIGGMVPFPDFENLQGRASDELSPDQRRTGV